MRQKLNSVIIGNAGGYWGDDQSALRRQVQGGTLHYVTLDFLAEVTMSILQKQKSRDPALGYARDFLAMVEPVLAEIVRKRVKIIANAGGVNPAACAYALRTLAQKIGVALRVGLVAGDDILTQIADLQKKGCAFGNMETGETFDTVASRIQSANVYLGLTGVVEALQADPDIVVTGRVTDTGITLAPMVHELGWATNDWDKLAAGIVAGHILECGTQATGGNFTDWRQVKKFKNMGFPIVEMFADGTFFITKHAGTGGMVTADTVREQLFYEMGNPQAYVTPDVVADFSSIRLEEAGPDRVRVTGVKGFEPTQEYKVSMAYADGYKTIGEIAVCGPNAREKAEIFAEIFWERVGQNFAATHTEYFGHDAFHRSLTQKDDGNEIMLRLGARDHDQDKLKVFAKTISALILSGPAGVCVLGGAPRVQEVISYWPALMPKNLVTPTFGILNETLTIAPCTAQVPTGNFLFHQQRGPSQTAEHATRSVQDLLKECDNAEWRVLSEICLGRSGDKGDTSNIGVMARDPDAYAFLEKFLTAQRVKDLFQELCLGKVVRYSVPNMLGFNFLLERSLNGGGTMSLRVDAQGKGFAQALLRTTAPISTLKTTAPRA